MWKFIQHELKYWIKSPMIWIFLFIVTLIVFFAVGSDNVQIGGGIGNTFRNAPYVIQNFYSLMSLICLLMTTSFMNATANRDFSSGMQQFIFSSPIKKSDYFFGKFIGASIISVVPLLGVSIGSLLASVLAPIFDMAPAVRFGATIWSGHLYGILIFALPNIIISGVLLYGLAIIYRSSIVSFIGSMLILVFYAVSGIFTADIKKEWIASLADPFGQKPFEIMTKYLTVDEKNSQAIGLVGEMLTNRLVWLAISIAILFAIYSRFSFETKNVKAKKVKSVNNNIAPIISFNENLKPTKANQFSWNIFYNLVKFETKAIIKNPTFIIIVTIGMIILITNLTNFTGNYGSKQYPVTYNVIDAISSSLGIFMIGFITFYTGIMIWSTRDAKMNEIADATPIRTKTIFASKLLSIMIALALVNIVAMFMGILAQSFYGYFNFEIGQYIKSLLIIDLSRLFGLVVLSMLFHTLINNRYIAYFAFVVFVIINGFIWRVLEIDSKMLAFNQRPRMIYSDMNGFGSFVSQNIWFGTYWALFSIILCFIITAFIVRGKEFDFKTRIQDAKKYFSVNKLSFALSILAFVVCSGFVYFNTQVLNDYQSSGEEEISSINYEKKYKKYENLIQPKFISFDYKIDLDPEENALKANIIAWAKNISEKSINEIHFTLPTLDEGIKIKIENSNLKLNDSLLKYQIYILQKPLMPNDSIKIIIDVKHEPKGFENSISFKGVIENGSFFNNSDLVPYFGYTADFEVGDKNKRKKLGLPERARMPKLDVNDTKSRSQAYIGDDANWVKMTTTISTAIDQTAIAPGTLVKSWTANNRKYFSYKLEQKSFNFYAFMSARYEIARKKWNGIDLEVYHDKKHAVNVPNIMKSMNQSLEYYTKNFGPYYHKQCRIIEYPRYETFAQAFPGTMPYAEGIGFITDLRNVTKKDIDPVFYIVAHEMAHQYWAHQVSGSKMQGSEFFSEGFAQYSALMVLEKEYGRDKMKKFLQYEMDDYLQGRSNELEGENPLFKTERQSYLHYAKSSIVMYYFKEMIGEAKVNEALKNIIVKFAYKEPPYATSIDVINEFKKVTPPELQYLITDMFENITIFSNRMISAKYKKVGAEYEVTLTTTSEKFRCNSLGKETAIPVDDFIDVSLFAKSDNDENQTGKVILTKRLKITKKDNIFKFKVKELPYNAGIDPYNYLIDRIPDDNLKALEE